MDATLPPLAPSEERYTSHLKSLGFDAAELSLASNGTVASISAPTRQRDTRPSMGAGAPELELPRMTLAEGDQGELGLIKTIGMGGMGKVMLALQRPLRREVAVKLPRTENVAHINAELLREALVTGRLEHPNIVPVHLLGQSDQGNPFFVMKRIEGTPWRKLLDEPEALAALGERASDPLRFHLGVLLEVCDAVSFAHSKGVLHRDLKPDNVMLGQFGEVYVLDWGIAVTLAPDPHLTAAHAAQGVCGTPAYMAPEMAAGEGARLSERTDVYLLGAVLHHVLAGKGPHSGPTLLATLTQAWEARPPVFAAHVPDELAAICRRALARDPADRFPSVQALRDAVEGFLRRRDSLALAAEGERRVAALELAVAQSAARHASGAGANAVGARGVGSDVGSTPAGGANAGGARGVGSDVGSTTAGGANAGGTSSVGANAVGTSSVGTSSVGTSSVGTSSVGASSVGANAVGANAVGANAVGANAVGTSSVGASSVGANAVGANAVGAGGVGADVGVASGSSGRGLEPGEVALDAEALHAMFTESRFAFQQVRAVPGLEAVAKQGVHRALVAIARAELAAENLAAARAHLAQLERVPAELQAEVEALKAKLDARQARVAALEQLEQDADLDLGSGARARVAFSVATVCSLTMLAIAVLLRAGLMEFGYREAVAGMSLFAAGTLGVEAWLRTQTSINAAQRKLLLANRLALLSFIVFWAGAWAWQVSFPAAASLFMFHVACMWGAASALFDSRGWPVATAFLVGSIVSAFLPGLQFETFAGATFLGFGGLGLTWKRRARAPAR